jgi:hypothetical protein
MSLRLMTAGEMEAMKFKMETRMDRTRTDAARAKTVEFRYLRACKRDRMEAK